MNRKILSKISTILREHVRLKKWKKVVSVMAAIVVFVTTYALVLPAITVEGKTYCGQQEHQHTESCYSKELTCELEEINTEDSTNTASSESDAEQETSESGKDSVHTHTDDCYTKTLTCGMEEHTHDVMCYSNPDADTEDASKWEKTIPDDLTGVWSDDLIAVAKSQIGYTESSENYSVDDVQDADGLMGYTRYGQWNDTPYAKWDALFVDFCLTYANISEDSFLQADTAADWITALGEQYESQKAEDESAQNVFKQVDSYTPVIGDLIFFDTDDNDEADYVAIVSEIDEKEQTIKVIGGDFEDQVMEKVYNLADDTIYGYAVLPENPDQTETGDTTDVVQENDSEPIKIDAVVSPEELESEINDDSDMQTDTEESESTSGSTTTTSRRKARSTTATGNVTVNVEKTWSDGGTHSNDTVTVNLLQDGEVYDSVELSTDNSWKYSWENLPDDYTYEVTEDALTGYDSKIETSKTTGQGLKAASSLTDGEQYVFAFSNDAYALQAVGTSYLVSYTSLGSTDGIIELDDSVIWTATASGSYYYLNSTVDNASEYLTIGTYNSNYVYATVASSSSARTMSYNSSTGALYYPYSSSAYYYVGSSSGIYYATGYSSSSVTPTYKFNLYQVVDKTIYDVSITNSKNSSGSSNTDNSSETAGSGNVTVNLEKNWSDGNDQHDGESVEVTLLRNGSNYKTIELSAENDWACTLADLPKGDYEISETPQDGYSADVETNISTSRSYEVASELEDGETYVFAYSSSGTIYVLAAQGSSKVLTSSTTLSDAARWKAEALSDGSGFYLSTKVDGVTQYMCDDDNNYDTTDSVVSSNQSYYVMNFYNYGLYNKLGSYYYFVGNSSGYIYNYTASSSTSRPSKAYTFTLNHVVESTVYDFTLTNTKQDTDSGDSGTTQGDTSTTVNVEKKWSDGNENHTDDSVTVVLKRNNATYDEQTLSAESSWKYTWTDLAEGTYTIEEKEVSGYSSEVKSEHNTVTASGLVKASELKDGESYVFAYKNGGKTYVLAAQGTGLKLTSKSVNDMDDTAIWTAQQVTDGDGFYLYSTVDDSVQYLYDDSSYITKKSISSSYKLLYNMNYDADGGGLYNAFGSNYYYVGDGEDVAAISTASGSPIKPDSAITFTLYRVVENGSVNDTVYDFTVTNTPTDTGSDASTQSDSGTSVVKVTKEWSDSSTTTHSNDTVTVHLLDKDGNRLDNRYAPITLTKSNSWTGSWENLPAGTYSVAEDPVDGYIPEYSGGLVSSGVMWVPATSFTDGEVYALVYKDSSGNYYTASAAGTNNALTGTAISQGTVSDSTYGTDYFTNIPEAAQWTAQTANSSSGFYLKNESGSVTQYMYCNYGSFETRSYNSSVLNIMYYMSTNYLYTGYNTNYYFMSGASGSTSYSSSSSAYVHSGASNVYLYKRVVVNPTYQYTIKNSPRITAGDSVVNVTATKTWTDDDSSGTKHQNDTVIVHLLDEEGNYLDNQYGTKELTASNNWTDTWENLPDAIYTVEEEIPDGYTSSATCTQNNTKTIFVPVTEIVNGGTYVIGSQYSSYYYNLWNASESSAKITTNRQRITTTSTTIGGVTYSNYLTNIPENEQWTFSEDAGTTLQGYETYRIQNVALSQYLHHNSDKYLDVSASSTLIYKDGYMFGISMKLTSGDYILRYFYDSGSNIYRYSNSTSGTSYYLFQKVSETDYTYTIQNAPKQDTDTIKSDEKYSKRIDALRDEQDNQDTDVDDDSEQDLTDLYRLYLDIGPMELNQGVDLLLVIDESKSMTTTSTYQNESLTRAEILTRILNGSSTEMTDDGLIQEFLSLNSKNRIGIEIFSGNKPAGGTGYTYIADITENTDADKTDEENEKRQSLLGTWFDDLNDFVEVIPQDFGSGSGTNYSAALLGARDMFNQLEDNGNKKVMVFLSDGVPTYYTNEDGTSRGGNGASRLCNTVLCKQPSIASFDSFHEMFPDVTTYTVGFATSISDEREDANPAVLRYMANVGGGDYIEADDGDALIAALEKYILGGGKYTGVSITDELSDYVDIAEQPDYKLTMTTVDGETITLWEKKTDASGNAVKDSDGNDIYEVTEAGENIIQSVTYDSKTQTVKATFYPDYALEVDAVYELSFNVNTSEFAYELTSANNQKGLDSYTDMEGTAKEGDATTDYKENDTSSLHPGFRSNKLAFVDYVQEGISQQLEYLHPVVQTSDRKQTEYELPMTGGIGTKWFTVTGFAIILGASAMFVWLTEINKHAHRSRRKRKIT